MIGVLFVLFCFLPVFFHTLYNRSSGPQISLDFFRKGISLIPGVGSQRTCMSEYGDKESLLLGGEAWAETDGVR